jgi:hypothetical protein
VFILLWGIVWLAGAQADWAALLVQADQAYQNGDLTNAANLYEAVVNGGVRDGTVYFNLGTVYYAAGDLGRALLNYRRALEIMPRDADLNVAIARIRAERLDVQGDEAELLDSIAALTAPVLTLSELAWLVLGLWTLWFGLLLVAVLRRHWRDVLRASLLIVGVVLLIGVLLLGSRLYVASHRPAAVVLHDLVSVMSGPGEDYLVLFPLHAAAEIRILEEHDGWVRFVLPDGRQGWLPQTSVQLVWPE